MPTSIFSNNIRETGPSTPSEPSTPSLSARNSAFLETLKSDFPDFSFKPGRKFLFRPKKSIFYLEDNDNFRLLLLHELSHALLGHFSYETSLDRLKIERDAWEKTRSLCEAYNVPFQEDFAEAELNSYRDWLHQKTLCKTCGLTCLEVDSESLYCPFCQKTFKRS